METLRRAHRLTCQLLLVWFALWIGAATAAPLLLPHDADVVCSAAGTLMPKPVDDGGAAQLSDHHHDCRLCVMVGVPPVPLVYAAHAAPGETPILQLPTPAPSQAPVPFQQRGPPQL